LGGPEFGCAYCQITHSLDYGYSLGYADRASGVQEIKKVGTFQDLIVGGKDWEAGLIGILFVLGQKAFTFGFVFSKKAPETVYVGHFEVPDAEL
jgi:hypothetical protein